MINEKKIIMMTKLAVYDKKYEIKDRKINEYFRHDYVFKKNFVLRFFVVIGGVFLILIYDLYQLLIANTDSFILNLQDVLRGNLIFLVVLLVFYTVIGSIKHNYEYTMCKKRMNRYFGLLQKLVQCSDNTNEGLEGDSES